MPMEIRVPVASLRDPSESAKTTINYEDAVFCDGSLCRAIMLSDDAELELLPLHWHIAVKGQSPEAGPRRYAVWP